MNIEGMNEGFFPKYSLLDKLIGIGSGIAAFVVYYITLTPSIPFWDSGEFVAASSILGIPHQPGSPFYVILGRIFFMMALLKDFAGRVNLLSAVASAVTVLVSFFMVVELIRILVKNDTIPWYGHLAACCGAIAMAFSYTYWTNSVEAEVYGTAGLFISLCLYLLLVWFRNPSRYSLLIVIAFLLGLSISNHMTSFLIAPAIVALVYIKLYPRIGTKAFFMTTGFVLVFFLLGVIKVDFVVEKFMNIVVLIILSCLIYSLYSGYSKKEISLNELRRFFKISLLSLVMFLLGLSAHLYLPVRSNLNPRIVNESKPNTWTMFWGFVNRQQYSQTSMFERKTDLSIQFKKEFWRYFEWQYFNPSKVNNTFKILMISVIIVLILYGVVSPLFYSIQDKSPPSDERRLVFWLNLLLFLLSTIGLFVYLNFSAEEVRDRDYFYAPTYMFCSFFLSIAIFYVIRMLEDRIYQIAGGAVFSILVLLGAASWWHEHDRAGNEVAADYGRNIINSMELNPVVFTNGDNDTFPPWALMCAFYYRPDVRLVNLSLINTSWYATQLMIDEPVTPFTMTKEQVVKLDEDLLHKYTATDWKSEVRRGEWGYSKGHVFNVGKLKLTVEEELMLPMFRDFMLFSIIEASMKKNMPIFFAVTVPQRNMELYHPLSRMEGMVSRITQEPLPDDFHMIRLISNAGKYYNCASLQDPSVFVDDETKRLSINYSIGLKKIADWGYGKGHYKLALRALTKAAQFKANDSRMRLVISIDLVRSGAIKEGQGMFDKALIDFEKEMTAKGVAVNQIKANKVFAYAEITNSLGLFYKSQKQYDKAKQAFNQAIQTFPYYNQAYSELAEIHVLQGNYKNAITILEKYLNQEVVIEGRIPPERVENMRRKLEEYKKHVSEVIPEKNDSASKADSLKKG
ncbi:MAG: DUF2723 domain-containing protein [Candidatus Coatesbacteria bacterium]|nr:DUF2723 domain-containing protein [Candidatus Coatesbacteria bacterium]